MSFIPRGKQRGPLGETQQDNDALTAHAAGAGQWGLPSIGGAVLDVPAELPPERFDYGKGIIEGDAGPDQANAYAPQAHPHLIPIRTDEPRPFQMPHEATHRRYEPPRLVSISQAAAGYSLIISPSALHYVKLIALNLTLDAAGTIKFVQSDALGTGVAAGAQPGDLTGSMAMGGGAVPPLNLAPADIENPWLFGSSDLSFGIFTVTGKAQGWAVVCFSPYDS